MSSSFLSRATQTFLVCALGAPLISSCTAPMEYTSTFPEKSLDARDSYVAVGSPPKSKPALRGVPYFLPDTVLPITVKGTFNSIGTATATDPEVEYQLSVTFGTPNQIADARKTYLLAFDLSIMTDDTESVAVGTNGLLTTANSQSNDETPQILPAVASLVATLASPVPIVLPPTAAPPPPISDAQRRTNCKVLLQPFEYDGQLNMSAIDEDSTENEFNAELAAINTIISQEMATSGAVVAGGTLLSPDGFTAVKVGSDAGNPSESGIANDAPGVLFRLAVPRNYAIRINVPAVTDNQGGSRCTLVQPAYRMLASGVPVTERNYIFAIDTSRAGFVQKSVNISATNGILTGVQITKPSEFIAAIKLPLAVVNAITTAVLGNLTSRTTAVSDQASYLQAEVNLLTQEQALQTAKSAAQSK